LQRHRLPPWYSETGAHSWAQFALRFIVSHPDVTCAIPATTRVDHVQENMAAGRGKMPDEALRYRMAQACWQRQQELPSWSDTAASATSALRQALASLSR